MEDPEELTFVVKALNDGLGGCVEWDEKSANLVRNHPDLKGLTPALIRRELIRLVRSEQVTVKQVEEQRHWKINYKYYYKALVPVEGFKNGLFVELRLVDCDDPDFPVVLLVGAHPQIKT